MNRRSVPRVFFFRSKTCCHRVVHTSAISPLPYMHAVTNLNCLPPRHGQLPLFRRPPSPSRPASCLPVRFSMVPPVSACAHARSTLCPCSGLNSAARLSPLVSFQDVYPILSIPFPSSGLFTISSHSEPPTRFCNRPLEPS